MLLRCWCCCCCLPLAVGIDVEADLFRGICDGRGFRVRGISTGMSSIVRFSIITVAPVDGLGVNCNARACLISNGIWYDTCPSRLG